jgi:hypothetical protein
MTLLARPWRHLPCGAGVRRRQSGAAANVRESISRDIPGGHPLEIPWSEHALTSARLCNQQPADGQTFPDHAEGRIAVPQVVGVREYPHGSLAPAWLDHVAQAKARSVRHLVAERPVRAGRENVVIQHPCRYGRPARTALRHACGDRWLTKEPS